METIRAFIAFPVPDELLSKLGGAQKTIMRNLPSLRPVKPQGIHLTLAFLGDISESRVCDVGLAMEDVCKKHHPMKLVCRLVGAFPDMRSPRVLWAGLEGDVALLVALQKDLADNLASLGFEMETRPFKPHLTLFRIKEQKQLGTLRKRVEELEDENFGEILCDTLTLFRSELKPDGAVYSKLKMVALD